MMQRMKGTLRPGRKAGVLALAVLLLTCVLMAGAVSAATTYYVNVSGDDTKNDGKSPGSPFATIQEAVNRTTGAGDRILVAAGTYDAFKIGTGKSGLTIEGTVEDNSLKTIIRTLNESSPTWKDNGCGGIDISSPSITLKNLSIQSEGYTNDRWYASPVGHWNENTNGKNGLTIDGCKITNAVADGKGIAIFFVASDITISNTSISGFNHGWHMEGSAGMGDISITDSSFDVTGSAINYIPYVEPTSSASFTISGTTFISGNVTLWDYANQKSIDTSSTSINSGIQNVELSENEYSENSNIILINFEGGQEAEVASTNKIPVMSYSELKYGVKLNPGASELVINYGSSSQITYTKEEDGSWKGDDGSVCDKDGKPCSAKIGDVYYPTLEDAFDSVKSEETIELLCDTNGNGIIVKENSEFTVDLGGHTYTVDGKTVGSPGTETNCFQLLKGSTLTFMNGKIVSGTDEAKMVIQNYADLTLVDVELQGGPTVQYVLSNNFGNTQLKGDTSIIASEGNVAFDVYYWPDGGYGEGVSVTIVDSTVKIQGKVEYARDDTASDDEFSEKASLTIPSGYTLEAPSGYHWASSGTEWKLVAGDPADIADTLVLTVNPQTVTAGNTVTLTATLTNSTSGTEFYGVPVTINGVSGVTGLTGAPITYTANTVGTFTLTAQTTDPALTSTSVTLTVNSRPVPPTPVTSSSGNMDNAYRVLFNDGSTTLSVVTDLSSGDKLTKPETPVKDGYTFAGWYKDSACTQAWDFETGIPGDMTLYAKWTAAGSSGETEATATPTATATAVTTPQPTKTQTAAATTSAPEATTAAGVSPTLTQAPAPVAGALFGLLAAGVLLRRRFQ